MLNQKVIVFTLKLFPPLAFDYKLSQPFLLPDPTIEFHSLGNNLNAADDLLHNNFFKM